MANEVNLWLCHLKSKLGSLSLAAANYSHWDPSLWVMPLQVRLFSFCCRGKRILTNGFTLDGTSNRTLEIVRRQGYLVFSVVFYCNF